MSVGVVGGIANRGNTCYISSALQLLFRFRPFHELLCELASRFPDCDFFAALANMSKKIGTSREPLSPDSVIAMFQIDPLKQFDVCEFMTTLVNRILEVSNDVSVAELVYFRFVEQDHQSNALFCSVPVYPNSSLTNAIANLRESFGQGFTSVPQLVLIQIGRMTFDGEKNLLEKDTRSMEISESLKLEGQVYYLYCVIEHLGLPDHGHYIAYVRDSRGWLKCNDSMITTSTLSDVQKSAVENAYVVAYVRDLDNVRIIRGQRPPVSASNDVGNLHIRLFDASVMQIVESMDVQASTFDDAIMTVNDFKAGWEQKYGDLRVRYKKKRGSLMPSFPRNISNLQEEDVLVWIEREDMEEFDPTSADTEQIFVNYVVYCPRIEISMAFYPFTKANRLIRYGYRFFNLISYGLATSRDISFYWEFDNRLVLLTEESLDGMTVQQFQSKHGHTTIVASPRSLIPPNAMRLHASVYHTKNELKEVQELDFLVSYHHTIAEALNSAKEILRVASVAMYEVTEDGRMVRIQYESDYDPLYAVMPETGRLRFEEVPGPNCYNFILVDNEDHFSGITFMFHIDDNETIEELEDKVQRYLDLSQVVVRFKPLKGEPFRPRIPYNEVPERDPFVALVSVRE